MRIKLKSSSNVPLVLLATASRRSQTIRPDRVT